MEKLSQTETISDVKLLSIDNRDYAKSLFKGKSY